MRSDIAEIRQLVAGLRAALLSPGVEAIQGCIPILEDAARRLRHIDPHSLNTADHAELVHLKRDLARVQAMASNGLALWQCWARLLGVATGAGPGVAGELASGYTAEGRDVARHSRRQVEG